MNALVTVQLIVTAENSCSICTGHNKIGIFDAFLLAQIHQRQKKNKGNEKEHRFDGALGAQGLGWEPGLPQCLLRRLLDVQSDCVMNVRVNPSFQGSFLDLIAFKHVETVCSHHPQ